MSYAAALVPALRNLAGLLTAAGVPAGLDRSTMTVPGAWVTPATARQVTLSGAGRARAHVLLVTTAGNDSEALEGLSGLLDRALTVISPDEDVDTSVVLSVRNNSLPAFRLAVDLTLEA